MLGMQSSPRGLKQTSLLILFAFVMLIVLLTAQTYMMPPRAYGDFPTTAGYGVGAAVIVAAAVLTMVWFRPRGDMSGGRVQTQMLICLAVSELGTLIGFVMHMASGAAVWPLAAGSIAVDILLVLPRVLGYWRLQG
jgi:hypothetical protein